MERMYIRDGGDSVLSVAAGGRCEGGARGTGLSWTAGVEENQDSADRPIGKSDSKNKRDEDGEEQEKRHQDWCHVFPILQLSRNIASQPSITLAPVDAFRYWQIRYGWRVTFSLL